MYPGAPKRGPEAEEMTQAALGKGTLRPHIPLIGNSGYLIVCPCGTGCKTVLRPHRSQPKQLRRAADLLQGGVRALQKHGLQAPSQAVANPPPLLPLAALSRSRLPTSSKGCCQPPPSSSSAHVLATETQVLKEANGQQAEPFRQEAQSNVSLCLLGAPFCSGSLANCSSSFGTAFRSWDSSGLGPHFTAVGPGEVHPELLSYLAHMNALLFLPLPMTALHIFDFFTTHFLPQLQ